MEFRILGPLEVDDDGYPLQVHGAKQRGLLALLLLSANEVVSTDRLIDALWPEEPPGSGPNALQARVSQLRKSLGAGAVALETKPTGYTMRLGPGQLDLHRFEQLIAEADSADVHEASSKLREGLGLWRGSALADFAYESWAQPAIARLEELRLAAIEKRIDADLELGRHAQLVGELEALASAHPLRERIRSRLMLSLYRSGRQAEALEVFAQTRRSLLDELGIEPTPALQQLQQAILRQDRSLQLAQLLTPERSVLIAVREPARLDGLLLLGELLSKRPPKELIVAVPLHDAGLLLSTNDLLGERRKELLERGVVTRTAAFVSSDPGFDLVRLAASHEVDLVVIDASNRLLDDDIVATLLENSTSDVAVLTAGDPAIGPVLVPFSGADHDWTAIELAAWIAGAQDSVLRIAGTEGDAQSGERDASRLLASVSITVQRVLGLAAEPLLIRPSPHEIVRATAGVGMVVAGLSERWQSDGLGATRTALAKDAACATLLVRRGLRPSGLAPRESLTRFTWSRRLLPP